MSALDIAAPTSFGITLSPDLGPGGSDRLTADVLSLRVIADVRTPAAFEVVVENWHGLERSYSWSDDARLRPGLSARIELGTVGDLRTIFTGEVTTLAPKFREDAAPTLAIRGFDQAHRLARSKRTRRFEDKRADQIARSIAGDAGLRFDGRGPSNVLPLVIQQGQTDWGFLQSLAASAGCECFLRNDTLQFRPPPLDAAPKCRLSLGRDLIAFAPTLSANGVVSEVVVNGWDQTGKRVVTGRARAGRESSRVRGSAPSSTASSASTRWFGPSIEVIDSESAPTKAAADSLAQAALDAHSLDLIEAQATLRADPRLMAGDTVEIEGAGSRFGGAYYVVGVEHTVDRDGTSRTVADLRRNTT